MCLFMYSVCGCFCLLGAGHDSGGWGSPSAHSDIPACTGQAFPWETRWWSCQRSGVTFHKPSSDRTVHVSRNAVMGERREPSVIGLIPRSSAFLYLWGLLFFLL